ncbi:hypothetical protein SLS55_010445 [Diplodia seriata]|uniref:Acyclic terpene utilisation N-terminal domain-containing protein n=1 Tax=Diplodia seriata TaxID=420778 RepID=A0ABR3BYJ1_9PEZI
MSYLTKLLELVDTFHVPLIFSSAGGDGTDDHVRELLHIIEDIAAREQNASYRFKTVALFAGIDKILVHDRLRAGQITGCGPCVPPLTAADIDATVTVVAQMGPEPFVDAMTAHPNFDVLVAGRAYDPAPYTAYATFLLGSKAAADPLLTGGFTHMGKIMECGGLCAQPKSHGAVATVYRNGAFDIAPLGPNAHCTPVSVAAHALYENTRPDILRGPGGSLELTGSTYEQLPDGRTVRVKGSVFRSSRSEGLPYRLKLEGATTVGWRTMFMGSCRDRKDADDREREKDADFGPYSDSHRPARRVARARQGLRRGPAPRHRRLVAARLPRLRRRQSGDLHRRRGACVVAAARDERRQHGPHRDYCRLGFFSSAPFPISLPRTVR